MSCTPATFSPLLLGAEILSLQASVVSNYSASVAEAYRFTQPSVELTDVTFCNVTVIYTHPDQKDSITVEAWLPVDDWNERFLAVGGGGWVAGRFFLSYANMQGALADGYATITTDAGLGSATEPSGWAMVSPGNVNAYNLQNLASVSLNDEAVIGKSLIKSFYGRDPSFSYWNGCSQGGRQGLMLAQRYPTAYDGIAAGAPAIYWTRFFAGDLWPQQLMNMLDEYPYGCEIQAITNAAILECDMLDGIVDGIIGEPSLCLATFDPFKFVGTEVTCAEKSNSTVQISSAAAKVVNATWHGPETATGKTWWYGLNPGADLTGLNGGSGAASTECTDEGCVGAPSALLLPWLALFVAKNRDFDFTNITHEEFDHLLHRSVQEYASILDTADPDLSEFRDAGGKIVMFHGLDDEIIPEPGSEQYYKSVSSTMSDVFDFYRYYQIPGLGHCWGGSTTPTNLFQQLRNWVENGTVPESTPFQVTDPEGLVQNRISCPYPQRAQFSASCGDVASADCWFCSGLLSTAPLTHGFEVTSEL